MKNRLEELDGLRGVAAFMVFLSHVIGLLVVTDFVFIYQNSPARIISDGAAAVDIFFVLSGFVLSLPFIDAGKKINYFTFVVKRVFRLYPTYWTCLILTIILNYFFNRSALNHLSDWAKTLWVNEITRDDILGHFPLIMKTDFHVIVPVAWTLAIEMKMSIILPIFIFFLQKWNGLVSQVVLLSISLILSNLSGKFEFLPLFIVGLVLSKNWRTFEVIKNFSNLKLLLLFILAIALIGNRFIMPFNHNPHFYSLITALGAALIILIAIYGGGVNKALKLPAVDFIGKISYSFYLYHLPILLVTLSFLYPIYESILFSAIVSFLITLFVSFISYLFIESNSMMLYRNISEWARRGIKLNIY